jgi:hypothetical protein
MPNWCQNDVTFRHEDKDKIKALAERFAVENGEPFQLLRPVPDPVPVSEKTFITTMDNDGNKSQIQTSMPDWYNWRVSNWGTKWEAAWPMVKEVSDNHIVVSFDTAWSPPIELYEYLTEQGWDIEAVYCEQGMGFCGQFSEGINSGYDISDAPEFLRDWFNLDEQEDLTI